MSTVLVVVVLAVVVLAECFLRNTSICGNVSLT